VLHRGVRSAPRPGRFTPRKETRYPIVQEAAPDWCGKSHPLAIRSPDRTAPSESLCLLCYPGPTLLVPNTQHIVTAGFKTSRISQHPLPPRCSGISNFFSLEAPHDLHGPHSTVLTQSVRAVQNELACRVPVLYRTLKTTRKTR
jgi:hypothetical protein